jgi:hypothetical protein
MPETTLQEQPTLLQSATTLSIRDVPIRDVMKRSA